METVQGIIDGFSEFVHNQSFMQEGNTIHLNYTLLPYDLIDDDLDFDELHYKSQCSTFDKLLDSEIMNQIKDGFGIKYRITKGRMVFRKLVMVEKITDYKCIFQSNKNIVVRQIQEFIEF
jgi:hypothetical protein